MNVLVILAIMGIIGILGAGYLGNDMSVMVQQFGVGSGDIESPVGNTELTVQIQRVSPSPTVFNDFIVQCNFTSLEVALPTGTKLFCKLYEGMDIKLSAVIAEGSEVLDSEVPAGTPIEIQIDVGSLAFANANDVDYVRSVAVLVQTPSALN